ncbi:hypothetical protein C0J52_03564 [Blattella germanica]|nr:hypothetical protein C0J52_03564 [Blattella germanica]
MYLMFVPSRMGRWKLLLNGYMYNKNKNSANYIIWRCIHRTACSASLWYYTEFPYRAVLRKSHSHPPDWGKYHEELANGAWPLNIMFKINCLSYKSVQLYTKLKINSHIAEQNKIQCETKIWKTLLKPNTIPNSPRSIAVASFRLETGHDCLAAHLYKIKLLDSPHCIVCNNINTIMNKDHLMFCVDLQKIVGTPFQIAEYYWEAHKQMMTNQEHQNI